MSRSSADDRRLDVLRAIVTQYVATREPVGSKAIAQSHDLGVSSATIRNDMAVLEDAGLIYQPHTSAGRVPTDRGYRVFVDRLATRGVDPATLSWDALRHGRDPWQITLTFIQGAEEKEARWELNLPARSVIALDDEARWLTEAASLGRRPSVFDQDTEASGASSHPEDAESAAPTSTDKILDDLASNRGRRLMVLEPLEEDEDSIRKDDEEGQAQVLSMSDHRRSYGQASAQAPSEVPVTGAVHTLTGAVRTTAGVQTALTGTQRPVEEEIVQDGAVETPDPRRSQRRRKRRQQVPSWDEIVFGAKPE